nr:hypothetical protein [Salsipaludibacter albus]
MRRVAARMEDEAAAMEGHLQRLLEEADAAFWQGADADAFRERLNAEHTTAVTRTVESVRTAAREMRRQAADQERTSAG